ncbi:MAG: cyclase family protein [Rhodobiaceae bacterium]|nr:cyclase family protein [Rhodobiaceae bacterium]MCC0057329.1 cyclase family protein [Rhodobiaceae bacterium]
MSGRWGPDDERGAANLIDAAAALRGSACVRTGQVVPLAIPIANGQLGPAADHRPAPQHYMTRHGGDYAAGLAEKPGYGFSDDVLMVPTHGTTHIDALAHVWQGGVMYNGFKATKVTSRGAAACGIDKAGPFVTRAIFVDFGGEGSDQTRAIMPDELVDAVAATGTTPEPGDALLIRTGWLGAWRDGAADKMSSAGLHHECAPWIVEAGFALVAADNIAVEVMPARDPACAMPLHIALTRDNGVYLAELFDFDTLAATGRTDCMLVIAPLNLKGGVGSPVTPVAIL